MSINIGEYLKWLEEDLIQATRDRKIRPWVIAGGHRPMYAIDNADSSGNLTGAPRKLQEAIEDLFLKYQECRTNKTSAVVCWIP